MAGGMDGDDEIVDEEDSFGYKVTIDIIKTEYISER